MNPLDQNTTITTTTRHISFVRPTPADKAPTTISPWEASAKASSFQDRILKPEYQQRKLRFEVGPNWFRVVPAFNGGSLRNGGACHLLANYLSRLTRPKLSYHGRERQRQRVRGCSYSKFKHKRAVVSCSA